VKIIQRMIQWGVQMECVKQKLAVFVICVSLLTANGTMGYIESNDAIKQLEKTTIFNPKTYSMPHSLPYLYFQVGNSIHIRNCLTGLIEYVFVLDDSEYMVTYERNAFCTYKKIMNNDEEIDRFRVINLDGSVNEILLKTIKSRMGTRSYDYRLKIVNNQIIRVVIETNIIEKNPEEATIVSQIYAEDADGVIWDIQAPDNHKYDFLNNDETNSEVIFISDYYQSNDDPKISTAMLDAQTGTVEYTRPLSQRIRMIQSSTYSNLAVLEHTEDDEIITSIIDKCTGNIVYESVNSCVSVSLLGDRIITASISQNCLYSYSKTEPIKITELSTTGEILSEYIFEPQIQNVFYDNCRILTNSIAILVQKDETRFYNYLSNQRLYSHPMIIKECYAYGNLIVCQDDYSLFALDSEDFSLVWQLDVIDPFKVKVIESEEQYFLGYDYKCNCYKNTGDSSETSTAARIKVVNKKDLTFEPYEYNICPSFYSINNMNPTKWGILFIDNRRISLYRPGNILVYELDFGVKIIEYEFNEDKKHIILYLDHTDESKRDVLFDISTGLYTYEN